MRRNKWLLWAVCVLLLAGCSLARPETEAEESAGDRWVGFYVVPDLEGEDGFYENPNLEEYGSVSAETEQFGTLVFPRDALFAVEDEAGNYTFPGLKGYSLFFYRKYREDQEGGYTAVGVASNMAPGEETTQIKYTDEGDFLSASGIVYVGPPLGETDWDPYTSGVIWHYYRVYQTEDGRIYLNGEGDSTNGPMTCTATETSASERNGKTIQEETISITAEVKAASRLERLTVTQFDGDNQILSAQDLALREELPSVRWEPGAEWALVEEASADGVKRTVYSVPGEGEEPVSHQVVLLDDEGMGMLAYLNME